MTSEPYRMALDHILAAGLTPALVVRGLQLLQRVHPEVGHVTLTWPAALDLLGLAHPGSLRRVLGALQAGRVLHYSTGSHVWVDFRAWEEEEKGGVGERGSGRAGERTEIANDANERMAANGGKGEAEGERGGVGERGSGRAEAVSGCARVAARQGEPEPRVDAQEPARERADSRRVDALIAVPGRANEERVDAPVAARERVKAAQVDAQEDALERATGVRVDAQGAEPARATDPRVDAQKPAPAIEQEPRVDAQEPARERADEARVDAQDEENECVKDRRADAQDDARERAAQTRADAQETARERAGRPRAYACAPRARVRARDRLIDVNLSPDPGDIDIYPEQDNRLSINQSARPRASPAEMAANRRLLADPEVRVGHPAAVQELAEGFAFTELLRQVFAWKNGALREPGALVYRCRRNLADPTQFQAPALSADDRASDLYRRHADALAPPPEESPPQEDEDECEPVAETGGAPPTAAETAREWPRWKECLCDARLRMHRATFEADLRGSRAVREGDRVTVQAVNGYAAEWLDKRLRPIVERAVAAVTGERLELVFVGSERGETRRE